MGPTTKNQGETKKVGVPLQAALLSIIFLVLKFTVVNCELYIAHIST